MVRKVFSIVVPIYQNEENLDTTLPQLLGLAKDLSSYELELVCVDDGSTDRSFEILARHQEAHPEVIKIVRLTKNFGQLPATLAGLSVARGDCIGIISADLQDPCELLSKMVGIWERGVKLVIAERGRRDEGLIQRLVSGLYWRLVRWLAVPGYPVGGYDYCVIDRQVASEALRISEKNSHLFVLFFAMGFSREVIRYERQRRTAGKSRWTLKKKLKLFTDTFVAFSNVPIRCITVLGLLSSALSVVSGILVAAYRLVYGNPIEGWTTLVVLTCFFGGLTLLALGIIGEYLWRILEETRKRPPFIIDSVVTRNAGEVPSVPQASRKTGIES